MRPFNLADKNQKNCQKLTLEIRLVLKIELISYWNRLPRKLTNLSTANTFNVRLATFQKKKRKR